MRVVTLVGLMINGLAGFQCTRDTARFSKARNHQSLLESAPTKTNVMDVKLEPEPEGGKELSPLKTLPNCRMKEMTGGLPGGGFQFWMTAQVEGKLVQAIRSQILKDASKKANFPGFRKVRETHLPICC
jgi:hypothetical protein